MKHNLKTKPDFSDDEEVQACEKREILEAYQTWFEAFEKELREKHILFKRLFEQQAVGLSTRDFIRFIEEILGESEQP